MIIMKLETVKVKNEKGYIIINKSDFDEKNHKLYQESKEKAEDKAK